MSHDSHNEKGATTPPTPDLPPVYTNTSDGTAKGSRTAAMFGGKDVAIGPRIIPVPDHLKSDETEIEESSSAMLDRQLAAEDGASIQYRTCSWQKTAALLFSEYICLAIMSFPWSYSYLGLVPGIILTIVVAAFVLYTSLILWQFCLRHPEVRDVCDIGQTLFTSKKLPWLGVFAWWATAVMFILNNTFIQALHVLVGAEYLNTMTASDSIGGCRTVEFSVVITVICWFASMPRTFSMMSKLGTASALFTFISVVLATIFVGIQGKPPKYYSDYMGEVKPHILPAPGTTWAHGIAVFLNISYTFIGQITLPSFIAEMRDPREFPKALWACTIAEIIVFSVVGGVIYSFTGVYVTGSAFGTLEERYKKISFSFMIPTLIFLGCLYASVTARFVFFRLFRNSRHLNDHTIVGWGSWSAILLATWIFAFIISQVIPFFNDCKSFCHSLLA